MESYLTIGSPGRGYFKDRGSKFIAITLPVGSTKEVKTHLEEIRKEFYDARHHCYAYVIGPQGDNYKTNDDGEPRHSAGDPILGQIRSLNLTFTLVVVVRYFGGTKLGVSGLINAYKTTASEALKNASIKKVVIKDPIELQYPYHQTNEVMRLVADLEIEITNQEFTHHCVLKGFILPSKQQALIKRSALIQGLEVQLDS